MGDFVETLWPLCQGTRTAYQANCIILGSRQLNLMSFLSTVVWQLPSIEHKVDKHGEQVWIWLFPSNKPHDNDDDDDDYGDDKSYSTHALKTKTCSRLDNKDARPLFNGIMHFHIKRYAKNKQMMSFKLQIVFVLYSINFRLLCSGNSSHFHALALTWSEESLWCFHTTLWPPICGALEIR